MLRIYLCSKCDFTRIVSNNHNSSCPVCNISMFKAPITYEEFIHFDRRQRDEFVSNCKNKIHKNIE